MELPKLSNLDISAKRVVVRADLDFDPADSQNLRLQALVPTLDYLKEKRSQIVLIGHRGRPGGKPDERLSLKGFESVFAKWGVTVEENLRFDPGEEANDLEFAQKLAALGDAYVNEAFGGSHRNHASIVSLPKLLPHAAGLHFIEETTNLGRVLEGAKHPVISIISGVKEDKLSYVSDFKKFSDKVLIGGRLPEYWGDKEEEKVMVAKLMPDREDITIHSIEAFEREISIAETILLSGPIGKFEEEGHRQGTKRVFEAVANSSAYKVAGGGDTEMAINLLGIKDKFDWISVGGGAMLEFLAKGTLPGIEALLR